MGLARLLHGIARQIGAQDPSTGADVLQVGDSTNNALRVTSQGPISAGQSGSAVNPLLTGRLDGSGNVNADSGNQDLILLPSATRTALTQSAVQTNRNARGVLIYMSVTAASGTGGLTINIEAVDPASGSVEFLNSSPAAITAITGNLAIYLLYPGASSTNAGINVHQVTSGILPATWRVRVTPGDSTNYTYSIGASLIL